MSTTRTCQVLVVGGGPGGYPAAIRASQLGLDTVIVDKHGLGGACLNRGCIPSKAFIHAASRYEDMVRHAEKDEMGLKVAQPTLDIAGVVSWKDDIVSRLTKGVGQLLQSAKVEVLAGWAIFRNAKTCVVQTEANETIKITAEHVILATGSREIELPFMPFGGDVIGSTQALGLTELPRKLVVVGGGYIGLELGIALRKMGSDVAVVEATDSILPGYDKELIRPVEMWLRKNKVELNTGCKAKGLIRVDDQTVLEFEDIKGKIHRIESDKVLVAVGRKPVTEGWGLENMGLDMDGPFVKINHQCRTAMRGVYAIGDLTGEPLLAHKASKQGELVAEIIAGHRRAYNPVSVATVCFTEPELVGVGLTPAEARAKGEAVMTGKFPLAASGRALTMGGGMDGGFVRVTARQSDHVILGIHAVGKHISELSGEFAMALEMGATLEDIAGVIHVHPTLTEGFAESALTALGHPIHISA